LSICHRPRSVGLRHQFQPAGCATLPRMAAIIGQARDAGKIRGWHAGTVSRNRQGKDRRMRDPQHILITGASSGIGAALAQSYARPGRHLSLHGRQRARLAEVATACRNLGASVAELIFDVADRAATEAMMLAVDGERALDLVIANAG